jgi:hypothetical protein
MQVHRLLWTVWLIFWWQGMVLCFAVHAARIEVRLFVCGGEGRFECRSAVTSIVRLLGGEQWDVDGA